MVSLMTIPLVDGPSDDDGLVAITSGMDGELGDDPASHQEALARTDSDAWRRAMQEEFDAQVANNTWTLTPLPKGRKASKFKWVFKTKCDAAGNTTRRKARLVVKG